MISLSYLTDAERLALTPALDEYIFTKDTRTLYYGDGDTPGGLSVIKDEIAALFANNIESNVEVHYDKELHTLRLRAQDQTKEIEEVDIRLQKLYQELKHENLLSKRALNDLIDNDTSPKTIISDNSHFLNLHGTISPNTSLINFFVSRGTTAVPEATHPADALSGYIVYGHDGKQYSEAVLVMGRVDANEAVSEGMIPGEFLVRVKSPNSLDPQQIQSLTFNSRGVLSVPVIQTGEYTSVAEVSKPRPGMIVFVAPHFYGYNGNEWSKLG
jgi:hypothetical protein